MTDPNVAELHRMLAELRQEYEQRAKPIIDALVRYEATRVRPWYIPTDQLENARVQIGAYLGSEWMTSTEWEAENGDKQSNRG